MIVLCKEYDKYGNRDPAHYIVKKDSTASDLRWLNLRQRFNPELHYYATILDEKGVDDETILRLFEDDNAVKEPPFFWEL